MKISQWLGFSRAEKWLAGWPASVREAEVVGLRDQAPFHLLEHFVRRGSWTRTNSAETVLRSGRGEDLHELIVDPKIDPRSGTAPADAPTARPRSGFRNISPISTPQIPALGAPVVVRSTGPMEPDLAVGVLVTGHEVFEVDQVILSEFDEGKWGSSLGSWSPRCIR